MEKSNKKNKKADNTGKNTKKLRFAKQVGSQGCEGSNPSFSANTNTVQQKC